MKSFRVDNYIVDTPIIEILERLRMELTNGKLRDIRVNHDNIVVTCPHHANGHENSPACNIYIGDDPKIGYGYFRCFVCEAQGSFIKFVQECFECSEDFAKNWLIKHYGVLAEVVAKMDEPINFYLAKTTRTKKQPILPASMFEGFQSWHPYLAQRKLSRDVCKLFNVMYDPKLRQVVFPINDQYGRLVMTARRSIDYHTFYMDKEVEKPVYCLDYLIKNDYKQAMLVEGPIDCLYCYTNGFPACAMLGEISPNQIEQLNRSPLQVIYIATDNDVAGEKFRAKLKQKLAKRILTVDVRVPSPKKDVNDLSPDEFKQLMKLVLNK